MLAARAVRSFTPLLRCPRYVAMSAPSPPPSTTAAAASVAKRALSTSPPPPAPPAAAAEAAADPASKKVKLTVEDPVSVPPVLVETAVDASAPPNEASSSTAEPSSAAAAPEVQAGSSKATGKDAGGGGKARKPRQRKGKAPKPGGVEEAGAFDVLELLGAERVQELQRLQEEEGRDWAKEAEEEWGKGAEGKDVEVRVVGSSDHGALPLLVRKLAPAAGIL